MKNQLSSVVFYNVWAHRYPWHLQHYLKATAPDTDIFCFTEVTDYTYELGKAPRVYTGNPAQEPAARVDGQSRLWRSLQHDFHSMYHSPERRVWQCRATQKLYHDVGFGSSLFYRSNLNVVAMGYEPIQFENTDIPPRVIQWIVYEKDGQRFTVGHLHGIWIASNTKGDAPERYLQSQKVRRVLGRLAQQYEAEKVIFGGDLNLALDTMALQTLVAGEAGESGTIYRNLIVEHGVESTRTKHYRKYKEAGASQHADYVMVSPEVEVHSFIVGNDAPASDHAPLRITFA